MADRQDSDREVLTSLPRSRPVRRSAKRSASPAARPTGKAGATTGANPAAAKTGARAAKPKPAAARARAATKAARPRATKAAPKTAARARTSGERPRRAPHRTVPPAGYAVPSSRAEQPAASGAAELIGTTLQAAAELAQIGLTVGRQTLQSMVDRLPKP